MGIESAKAPDLRRAASRKAGPSGAPHDPGAPHDTCGYRTAPAARPRAALPAARGGLALAAAFALAALAGCGGKAPAGSGTGAGEESPKPPITLKFFTVDLTEDTAFDDPVAREITRRTGVTLEIDHPLAGDQQTIPLMIASGQYPDIIYAKGDLALLVEAGAVIPLDDLIAAKGENLRELYGDQLGRLRFSPEDPRIYSVGTYGVREGMWQVDGTLQLQLAVLKELGYPKIETFEDYENALKAYMAKYPRIDGRETIGLSLLLDAWQWYIDLSNPAGFAIGYPDDGQWLVDDESLAARYKFLDPDIRLYYEWLCRLNAEGLLDPESFTQSEDVWKSKIASGRVLGLAYPLWGYADARATLIRKGMGERTYAYLPVVADRRFRSMALKDPGFTGGWGVAISSTCADPERAFEFLDWLCSEEAQILVNWGIEGKNYEVEGGKRVVPAEEQFRIDTDANYAKKTGVTRWTYPFPQYGSAWIDSTGNYVTRDSPERIRATYIPEERETLAGYGVSMWTDLFPSSGSLGVSRHGQAWLYQLPPNLTAKITAADEYMKTALVNAILGPPGGFDAAWAKIREDLRTMGMERTDEAMTGLIRQKVAMWSEETE